MTVAENLEVLLEAVDTLAANCDDLAPGELPADLEARLASALLDTAHADEVHRALVAAAAAKVPVKPPKRKRRPQALTEQWVNGRAPEFDAGGSPPWHEMTPPRGSTRTPA
jgi:hypothetical protein